MIAGGIELHSAPNALSYYTLASSWNMPAIGGNLGSGEAAQRRVDVRGNHYTVSDMGTTDRFVYGANVYLTATEYDAANSADGSSISSLTGGGVDSSLPTVAGWTETLFEETFSTAAINTSKWNVRNGTTQPDMDGINYAVNCSIANGYLSIRSGLTGDAVHPWSCGYIDTINKFSTRDGRWEARMRFPWGAAAYGYVPSFSLRPDDNGDGEIDIMQAWPLQGQIAETIWKDYTGTAHPQHTVGVAGFDPTQWHIYAVEKVAGSLKFYIDGILQWDATDVAIWRAATFDRVVNWHLRISLGIGGAYGGKPTATTDLAGTLDIDYVRVLGKVSSTTVPLPPPVGGGTSFNALVNNATSVSLEAGTYSFSDFAVSGDSGTWLKTCTTLTGTGIDTTVIQMNPHTSTKQSYVSGIPYGETNQLFLLRTGATSPGPKVILQDFTLRGTAQGHDYNGIDIMYSNAPLLKNLKVTGVPGSSTAPPGETFTVSLWHSNNGLLSGVELDGKQDGVRVAASVLGINSSNDVVVENSLIHSNKIAFGIATWRSNNFTVRNTTFTDLVDRPVHIEQCSGTYTFDHCTFVSNVDTGEGHIFAEAAPGFGASCIIRIINPTFDTINGHYPNRFVVSIPSTYSWNGNTYTNSQRRSDVSLIIDGTPRPDLLQFV